jgi:cobalt/nickel transport protein
MKRNIISLLFLSLNALGYGASPTQAHEFWIAPEQYQVAPQETITAKFKNGEDFAGVELGYFHRRSERLEAWLGWAPIELSARDGDRPAFALPPQPAGLVILAHETTSSVITYKSWEKFENFADHKGFANFAKRHEERGLPPNNFSESYTRHVKALVSVGNGDDSGTDRPLGLATEIVALSSPYGTQPPQIMSFQLLLAGAPRVDAQIEVFEKAPDGKVRVFTHRTDALGIASIPVKQGHEYLLDAVTLQKPAPGSAYAWETLWASLTFFVPTGQVIEK